MLFLQGGLICPKKATFYLKEIFKIILHVQGHCYWQPNYTVKYLYNYFILR